MKKKKNTRLVFIDEKNLKIYQALSAEDFKEFFMKYLSYKVDDDVEITDFSSPSLYGLFMMYKDKIDFNETKWKKQAEANKENGKKGGRPKKSALQEVKETEFDLPKTDDNVENENKADLSPSKPSVDAEYHQQVEMPSNGLKTGKEEILEEDIINILNDNDIMSNPTNVRIDKETGKYYTDEKIKEIREKVEKSNNKPLPVMEDNIPLWEDYLKSISSKLRDIINDLNSNSRLRRTIQAPTNLKELLNNNVGRYYKDRVLRIIEHYTTQQTVA